FRIELGEIESQLSRAPGVREAVVLARTDRSGQKYLCGYVVASEEVSVATLQEHLAGSLPGYMIPDTFVFLSELPLTANGKIDRKALSEPEAAYAAAEPAAGPQSETEAALLEIWEEVLDLPGLGTTQDFFALGGHSLSAIQVLTRVRRLFEVDLPLPDLFENPTVAGLAAVLDRLRGTGAMASPLRRFERPKRLPLSFAQERLWFLDRLQPDSPFYNLPMALEMHGALSVPALAASLGEVVRRHEGLRTRFLMVAGHPVQEIVPTLDVAPPWVDLSGLSAALQEDEAARLARVLAVQPFDLSTGPLLRSTLLRLDPERHVGLFSLHHIVTDGWSMALLMQEVAELYRAATAGEPSPLPELPVQYADFTLWQRASLSGAALEEQIGWWRQSLAGAPHVLDLPTDRPRPAVQSLRGAHAFAFLSADLRKLSLEQGVTPFMTLLALFGALLHRYTGVEDLLVGSPIAGRNHAEFERLIGLFVNTLVLRVEMQGDPTLAEALGRVRERTVGAYAHQDLPFEKLVEELHPERSLAHTPLFQVMLVQQNAPVEAVEIPGLTFLPRPAESGTARFDLHLALTDTPSGLFADLEYNRDLFDPATMARLLGHLRLLAEGAVRDPRARLSELPLLSDGESHQIRLGWNDTAVERRPGLTLPALFAEQVRQTPEAPAVTFEGRTLSYRELDLLSGRLATRLLALGVEPDAAVGVLMERSAEMVVALLGILKAGAAYLPLDPEYPAERLGWILGDARVPVVLAQERLLGSLELAETRVLCLEEGWEDQGAPAVRSGLSDQSLAYVLYTSGSTGRPKGVMIPHRGIVNRLLWMQETYGLTPEDTVLQKTPYSFDVSVWELFWPLITGARLVMARPGGHRDGAYLTELIERERATVMHFVPSMLQAFLEEPDLSGCASLRLVVASGEALTPELRRRFRERLGARLENLYGPTEAAVDVTSWNCATEARGGIVPIGRPVANTRIHLLDRALAPVPIGIPGELCIGGVQLARGYWRRPDLTAERFVPGEAGERLYRTGDLARYLPDGAVEYLGRLDFQVKVRGFRIELGEIESVLASHPGVRETVVVAKDGRLVAYAALHAAVEISELRSFLAARLPEHMVPPAWVVLDGLPLTPSGKVDRGALPAPEATAVRDYIAPQSPLEQVVAGIWAELLKVERVGLADNFFDLGGDSIKAVRLVSRVNERLGADLRVQDVFKHQTVGSLAGRIATRSERSQADDLAAGRAEIERLQRAVLADPRQRAKLPEGYEDFFPLSGVEKGMIYYTLLLPEQPVYHDQHAYVLSIPSLDGFYRALELVMGRHQVLRSTFHLDELEEPMKVVHRSVPVVRDVEDLSGLPAAEQRRRIESYRAEDLRRKFTFRGEILWRLKLFRLEGDSFVTVWTWHHAILDGWSNLTFWIDLNELLAREDLDRIEAVAPLASSYKDYLAISLGRLRAPETESFWLATLAGASRNKLPFHRATTRERSAFGMRSLYRPLSREALLGLRERAAELSVPLQALFLAAHIHLLRVTSGEEDVVTGVVSHDRPGIPDGDKIVGCFLNTFPIRLRLEPGESGATLARRVARFLAVEKEHEIPLVDIAGIVGARESAQNPVFDTLLNFMDFHLIEEVRENVLFRPRMGQASRELPDFQSDEMTNTLFDLEVSAALANPFLRLKYLPRHFEAADVERALALYDRILEALRRDPEAPLGTEALLTGEERGQLVHVYNDTARVYPRERPLHSFFEEQAARAPERLAVLVGDRSLTYGEIESEANRLARHLLAQGVRPGDNVGVCFERAPELVVALLGVLKAGAAYVPMEPTYPAARKEHIVRQSAVSLLLEELPANLDGFSGAPVPVRPWPDSLAYTIYTSGSTGTPKGVMIEHHSAANLIAWVNREFEVGPETRVLMLSSICFDLSVYDVFGALGAGASLVIARQAEIQDPAALLRLAVERKITFWNSVPSTLGLLVQYLEETDPGFRGEDLRIAFLSGDWIPLSLPERAKRFFPNLRVISLGGATEGTVWSIFHPVEKIDEAWASIPYGKPLDNNTFYILDGNQELVPPGVVGDLYIGGVGVARGYAGDPEKTAASYRPDPFSGPGQRLYRTGDLGRMLPEGEIEFLGRSDHQVKVRGFRIELGEIESQLSRAPGVREAVVLARTDRSGQKYLCGYVVASDEVSVPSLQEHLAGSLPGYMIPDTFVFLSELPLTPNGKIDRKALPEPEAAYATAEPAVGPQSETESALLEIWEEVLGLSGLGTTLDFFALGGHSLSAIQILTRVRRRFEVDLPLPDFFESPTVAGLAAVIERLQGAELAVPQLVRSERPERLPLSFAQERLWFLDRLQPDSPFYNLPLAIEMRGALSVPTLAASLSEVVRRHEGLRTSFPRVNDSPVQRIAPTLDVAPPRVDLDGLPADAVEPEVARLTRDLAVQPFDLAEGPLLRSALLRLGPERHVVLFSIHHIVTDGWSMALLMQEVAELYRAATEGVPSPLPELPVQYADFALWQRGWLSGATLEKETGWWRQSLTGAPFVLDLPTDRPRPAVQSLRGAHAFSLLPADLAREIQELSLGQGVTPFMTLLALFGALLHRYTGVEDLLVGSPIAGRNHPEVERLIGLFVNTLVLRVEMHGDPALAQVLGRVRDRTVGAYAHQDLPFEKLVEELQPERSLAHTPLFQVMLVQQNAPGGAVEIPGLTFLPRPAESGTARFDLHLALTDTPSGLLANLEYNRDLFDPATMTRLLGHLRLLAEGAVRDPQARLSELPLLSGPESHQLRLGWNDTAVERRPGLTLPALFAEQVARAPEAPAVTFEGRTLSCRELDLLSGRLAAHLLDLGVAPDTAVGVLMERSAEMVVALLGVQKAGAAYLPLDPEYPAERLGWILKDARVPVLLAQERLLPALPPTEARVLFLEDGWEGDGEPASRADLPDPSLAYVLYTSGSTGKPKGVTIPHRGIVNRLLWMQEAYGLTPEDTVLQKTPYSFDVSVWEFFWPLSTGAHLVVARPGGHRDSAYLAGLIERERITVIHFVPSMLQAFLEEPDLSGCASLRLVVASGEALTPELRRRFRERIAARLENLYGPTEASVDVTAWNCEVEARGGIVPIGRPVANTRVHLLDRALKPVPAGIPGELSIGGVQLARGYLNRPDLTAERFVPDPCGGAAGDRLYRTGDLARHLPDGAVEYLGRLDFQVKVRGFRIELGEIEAVLASHPGVRETVVVARDGGAGDRRLVAYVAPRAGAAPDLSELRAFLAARVPEHMVPPAWVVLDELPLTPSGKVDRKALPEPGTAAAGEYVAPRNPAEEVLAGIWGEVLGRERIGVEDNFFRLGGHSLLATRIVSRVRSVFGVELPVRALFELPTVAELSAAVEAERRAGSGTAAPPLVPVPRDRDLPLSFSQERLWFFAQLEPESPAYNMPAAVRLEGLLDAAVLDASFGEIAARHESLRTTFHLAGEQPVQRIVPPGPFGLPRVDLHGLPAGRREAEAARLAGEEAGRPFDLARGPLLRGTLLRLGGEDHVLLFNMHHIVSDGWSIGVMLRELAALYPARSEGRPSPLPPLPVQYADFAAWQRGWMQGDRLSALLAHQRERLEGAPLVLELPSDRPHRPVPSGRAEGRIATVPAHRLDAVAALARREGVTLYMALLAVFDTLLHRYTGREDFLVGTHVAGRNRAETEGLIGFFINELVLRADLSGDPPFLSLLPRVRETALDAYAYEDLPFDRLVEELQPARDLARPPVIQVLFVLQNLEEASLESLELPGLTLTPFQAAVSPTTLDLTLEATETDSGLLLSSRYNTDLFDATTIDRLLGHFEALLESASASPETRLSLLPLLTGAERQQLVREWNDS
ncbi:MAG TPA: amino acid adenylation domain-containing protein, partial [Thermoanaerobaculia bacterium]|nr:amino acid adenylation domain-containing protein [Thermoanaerobaculia bacterium]